MLPKLFIDKLRLSSKSHWDVPIKVNNEIVHALVSHPTPPVFDGTEDRNGKRNSDEIRFWADYVSPGQGGYIYDDKGGKGGVFDPFVKEFSLTTGREIRSLAIPTKFLPKVTDTNGNGIIDAPDTQTAGIRNNLAFESLTISPNQKTLYTATENALFQDGDRVTVTTGSRSRIIQYNLVTGQPEKEYLYSTDAVAKAPIPATGASDSGLVDLLAIDDRGTFLALERSFAVGRGNTIKVYEVTIQGATDISPIDALSSLSASQLQAIAPVQKRLILDLDSLGVAELMYDMTIETQKQYSKKDGIFSYINS